MDALTDILKTVHLQGSIYCRSELTAPWGMAVPTSEAAQFHVVRYGRCWIRLEDPAGGTESFTLEVGDLVVLPGGSAHVLADGPRTQPRPMSEMMAEHQAKGAQGPLFAGGGGELTTLICGYFQFDAGQVHPLLSVLPPSIVLRGEGGRARSWLESTLDLIAQESIAGRPGGEILIDRLTETMFIQVVRSYLERQADGDPSWLNGLRDGQISRALGLIHRFPERQWAVAQLATKVGMSRSAFSSRFHQLVGEPPLQYLTRWRMQVAAWRLRDSQSSLTEIAEQVGYQAEAAFSRVFKRLWGISPGAYRRQAQVA